MLSTNKWQSHINKGYLNAMCNAHVTSWLHIGHWQTHNNIIYTFANAYRMYIYWILQLYIIVGHVNTNEPFQKKAFQYFSLIYNAYYRLLILIYELMHIVIWVIGTNYKTISINVCDFLSKESHMIVIIIRILLNYGTVTKYPCP